jgi:hypothetical protein
MTGTVADVTDRTRPAPTTLRWGIRLLLGQAAVVTAVFGYVVYRSVTATAVIVRDVALVVVFTAVMAALLWLCAWALSRRYGWVRGPSVVLELMLLPIGYFMIAAGRLWIGLPVLALGLVGAGLLVAPTTREALGVK